MLPIRLDIILPCYNPPKDWAMRLPEMLQRIQSEIQQELEITLILVNDGSKMGIADADVGWLQGNLPRFRYLSYHPNQGKGHALREGVALATGQFQIYTDIDFPYSVQSFAALFAALVEGKADVAAGVRNAEYYLHVPRARKVISKVLRWLLKTFLRTKITDTQCGLKGFNANGREIFLKTKIERFLFDLEFIYLVSNAGAVTIAPVEVQLNPEVVFSKARLGIVLRESINFASIFFRGLYARVVGGGS